MIPNLIHALEVPSPLGRLRLFATEAALVGLYLPEHRGAAVPCPAPDPAPDPAHHPAHHPAAILVLERARSQLAEYFAGTRTTFELPLDPAGTAFQRAVWEALRAIPFGATVSYAALAAGIGRPRAVRAVGAANARNPVSIVVPCHRVIGADGSLTGYAGGLAHKRWLLDHERAARTGAGAGAKATEGRGSGASCVRPA